MLRNLENNLYEIISSGVQIRAKNASQPYKKADALPVQCIEKLVHTHFTAHANTLHLQPIHKLRTTVFALTGFFIIGRPSEVHELKAHQLELQQRDGKEMIFVTLRKAKNMGQKTSQTTVIAPAADNASFCPVAVLKAYFLRMGLSFGGGTTRDNNFFMPQTYPSEKIINGQSCQVAWGSKQISYGRLIQDLKLQVREAGFPHLYVTGKSAKCGGVSAGLNANIPDRQLTDLGRWRTDAMLSVYRRDLAHNQVRAASALTNFVTQNQAVAAAPPPPPAPPATHPSANPLQSDPPAPIHPPPQPHPAPTPIVLPQAGPSAPTALPPSVFRPIIHNMQISTAMTPTPHVNPNISIWRH